MDASEAINDVINGLHEVARARLDTEHPSEKFVELLIEYLQDCWGVTTKP